MITYNEYVEYHTFNSAEAIRSWLTTDNNLISNLDNYMSIIENMISYKEKTKKKYKERGSKSAYNNIYAHNIIIMLPISKDFDEFKFIKTFMASIDGLYKTDRYLYIYKIIEKGSGKYADIMCFTRKVYKRKQKKILTWNQNYYWNPIRKKRTTDNDPDAILLHKKGDFIYDKAGNKQYISYFISLKEEHFFKYRSFSNFIKRLKKAVKYAKQILIGNYWNEQIKYFSYITVRPSMSTLKKRKLEIRNNLIKRMNLLLYECQNNLIFGYFYDELEKDFHKLIYKIDVMLHSVNFTDEMTNKKLYTGNKQSFASLNENIQLLEENLNNRLEEWWSTNIYMPFLKEMNRGDLHAMQN